METNKTLVCPNCGANITNVRNCEYCGSLLVRFVDKCVDLQKTTYLDNSNTFSNLLSELKMCLQLSSRSSEIIALDIYADVKEYPGQIPVPIGTVVMNATCKFADGTSIPNSTDGLSIILQLDLHGESYKKQNDFRKLNCFPLFLEKISVVKRRSIAEYYINFGYDAEGAARLLSDIIMSVYRVKKRQLICEVNVGYDIIKKSRKHRIKKADNIVWTITGSVCFLGGQLFRNDFVGGLIFAGFVIISIIVSIIYLRWISGTFYSKLR